MPANSSSMSLFSSSLAFLFAEALFVVAVAVERGRTFAAAVTILVVFVVSALARAAARALVMRFGGESIIEYLNVKRARVLIRASQNNLGNVKQRRLHCVFSRYSNHVGDEFVDDWPGVFCGWRA